MWIRHHTQPAGTPRLGHPTVATESEPRILNRRSVEEVWVVDEDLAPHAARRHGAAGASDGSPVVRHPPRVASPERVRRGASSLLVLKPTHTPPPGPHQPTSPAPARAAPPRKQSRPPPRSEAPHLRRASPGSSSFQRPRSQTALYWLGSNEVARRCRSYASTPYRIDRGPSSALR